MEHLYQNIVKISCQGEQDSDQGSGILFYPEEGIHFIILSAKHVLEKTDIDNYRIECISTGDEGFTSIVLDEKVGDHFIFDDECDLGAIVLLKSRINSKISINCLEAIDRKFDFQNCISLGYPEKNKNDIKSIKSTYRAQMESNEFIFESVLSGENLEELDSTSYDNLVGMSGGGLFYHNNSEYYLSGINFEFKNGYKSFHTISISKVNEFLQQNNLSKIPLTYGTACGINRKWIQEKLTQAHKELGERYTSEIESLDVPQMQYFKYLELGEQFRVDVGDHFHKFILILRGSRNSLNKEITSELYDETMVLSDLLVTKHKETSWYVSGFEKSLLPISELEQYRKSVQNTIEKLQKEKLNILEKRAEDAKTGGKKIDTYYDNPLSSELNQLYKIENELDQFIKYLNGNKIKIGQTGLLVISGNAGNGKSHLLGDVTNLRIKQGLPSILVLGEKILGQNDPREQILTILRVKNCSWDELLINFNEIGKFLNERFIFSIDALNEGNGRNIWPSYLAGFIEEFKRYPYVGLVVSIRSTYLDVILPENRFPNNEIIRIEHKGFQSMGLKALSHFCRCFNLHQPAMPLLSPEFTNAQFLLLTCKTLKALGRKEFPKGVQGITKMYKEYTLAITQKFRTDLKYDIPTTLNIVEHFLLYLHNKLPAVKRLDDVIEIFKGYTYQSNFPNLINDLIKENILSEEITYISPNESDVPVIKFTYEKLANHIEIKNILSDCHKDSVKGLFDKGGYFFIMSHQKYHLDEGLLEALTIQLPELFKIEIFELFSKEWLNQFKSGNYKFNQIKKVWLNGFLWRLGEDIDIEKCIEFINSHILPDENFSNHLIDIFINLAIVKDHPFNALQLHNWLMKIPMADRDIVWTKEIYHQFNMYLEEDEENSFAISRMIDWVLEMDEHTNLDDDSRFLYCLTLGWFLGSNFQPLRDASTIGIVKLLEEHIHLLIRLLQKFENVNDWYVLERLMAAAYGLVLRSDDHSKISDLGTYIYQTYFDERSLPVHIMIRDYARCIVEYVVQITDNHSFDLSKIRPPYIAEMIQKLPNEENCRKLELKFNSNFSYDEKCCYRGNHFIYDKYLGIDSDKLGLRWSIENFYYIPNWVKQNYKNVLKGLSSEKRKLINLISVSEKRSKSEIKVDGLGLSMMESLYGIVPSEEEKLTYSKYIKRLNLRNNLIQRIMRLKYNLHTKKLERILTVNELKDYHNNVLPYYKMSERSNSRYDNILDTRDYLPWIVNQIFDKGYDNTEHGHFDGTFVEGHYSSKIKHQKYGGHLETFGEKYGNIASEELLARISDNYDLIQDWGDNKIFPYNYARQIVKWSDIDPCNTNFYSKLNEDKGNKKDNLYKNWEEPNWLSIDDWPTISNLITYKDENKEEFINLLCKRGFDEPIEIGEKKYHVSKKELNIFGHSFIVNTSDLSKIFKGLKKRIDNNQLSGMFTRHNIFDREFYWSEIYNFGKNEDRAPLDFNYFGNGWLMHIPIEMYQSEGEFQYQTSSYKVSKVLFEGLGLKYSYKCGELLNSKDQKVVFDADEPFENIFINKKILLEFLKENGLTLLYAIRGEKMDTRYDSNSVLGAVYRQYYIGTHYFDQNGELISDYKLSNKDPKY